MFRRNIHTPLPRWEQTLYWMIETLTVIYMIYNLYIVSEDAWRRNEPIHLGKGWSVIGRPRDSEDSEWEFWSSFFWKVLPPLAGHTILSCVCSTVFTSMKIKQMILTVYDMLALSYIFGFYTLTFMCIQPVVCHLASYLGNSKIVWTVTLSFISVLNFFPSAIVHFLYYRLGKSMSHTEFHVWYYMCVFVWANLCQRATAFALECVWVRQMRKHNNTKHNKAGLSGTDREPRHVKADANDNTTSSTSDMFSWNTLNELPGWLDMFFYMFYFPVFFTGPLIVYNNFHNQLRAAKPCTRRRVKDIALKLVRIMIWAVINCVILHYIYPHALNQNRRVLAKQSRWTLAAIGWVLGQFFMMKYLVIFGFPAQVARIEGFEPPAVPACISYVYCYGDMWKSFDRGLYDFLKRYIFVPFGGSRVGIIRQVFGSVLCFAYIFHWHGGEWHLFLWCVVNFIETSLEQLGAWLESTPLVKRHLYDRLSEVGKRRLRAIASVPLFLMSVFAIFYFFGGSEMTGDIFLNKLLIDNPWPYFCVFMLLVYTAIQNAMEVERLGLTKYKVVEQRSS